MCSQNKIQFASFLLSYQTHLIRPAVARSSVTRWQRGKLYLNIAFSELSNMDSLKRSLQRRAIANLVSASRGSLSFDLGHSPAKLFESGLPHSPGRGVYLSNMVASSPCQCYEVPSSANPSGIPLRRSRGTRTIDNCQSNSDNNSNSNNISNNITLVITHKRPCIY